jgi:broad specificity phosphatase PhoE
MSKNLVILCRHGSTTDSNLNILRGQRNSALDKQGFLDANKQKDFCKKLAWQYIFCSDLTRAKQTADIIIDGKPGERPGIVPNLRPWNIGCLTGLDKDKAGPKMQHYIDHPEEVIPDGESMAQFEQRVFPLFGEAMALGIAGIPPILIMHSSLIHVLGHLLTGEREDHPEAAVNPGGIVMVYLDDDGEFQTKAVLKKGHDDSSFAADKKSTS